GDPGEAARERADFETGRKLNEARACSYESQSRAAEKSAAALDETVMRALQAAFPGGHVVKLHDGTMVELPMRVNDFLNEHAGGHIPQSNADKAAVADAAEALTDPEGSLGAAGVNPGP